MVPALEAVATRGLTEAARELAAAALSALSDMKLTMVVEGQKHVMLSYQWGVQELVKRIKNELQARGYRTWFGAHLHRLLVLQTQRAAVLLFSS